MCTSRRKIEEFSEKKPSLPLSRLCLSIKRNGSRVCARTHIFVGTIKYFSFTVPDCLRYLYRFYSIDEWSVVFVEIIIKKSQTPKEGIPVANL